MFKSVLSKIQRNWKSGLTVALVSIPLSVSLAVASGANPVQGIITAVWAGMIEALLGGSSYNIVGPAGALTGILASFALQYGPQYLPSLAIVSGVMILISGVLKLEKYLIYIPASVIHGFTLGVAILIAFGQFNAALGLSGLPAHEKFVDNFIESFRHFGDISIAVISVFLFFLILLFVLAKLLPKVPGALLVAPIGIFLGILASKGLFLNSLPTLGSKFPGLSGAIYFPNTLSFESFIFVPALSVAIVAVIETLLSAKIADGMTKTKYRRRKEVFGLGFANIVSGLFGGLPATGVLVRTVLNIKSGANSKFSALINSIFVAFISVFFLQYFRFLPLSVIASILMFIAYRMIGFDHFRNMWKFDKLGLFVAILVAVITVINDPIIGIMAGTVISLLKLVEKISKGQYEIELGKVNKGLLYKETGESIKSINKKGDTLVYSVKGQLLHLNTHAHLARFEMGLNGYKNIILRLRELYFIDFDGVECITEIIEDVERQGRRIAITGVNEFVEKLLKQSPRYNELVNEGLVFDRTSEALRHFGHKIKVN